MVRRLVAVLLGLALAYMGHVSALHTHFYTDHDHPEHHHGPAAHDHDGDHHVFKTHSEENAPAVKPCDPGRHAVALTVGCAALTHPHTGAAECGTAAIPDPLIPSLPATTLTDVRVHGPPARTQGPPRAPPLILHS
jgi:hypothetical protein